MYILLRPVDKYKSRNSKNQPMINIIDHIYHIVSKKMCIESFNFKKKVFKFVKNIQLF